MPADRHIPDNRSTAMPSRATSAFFATVRSALHERACDYVMWVAGHGGDTATIQRYNQAVSIFPSHFNEWTHSMSRSDLVASIPILRSLLPGLIPTRTYTGEDMSGGTPHPLPEPISLVVTLATQQHILKKAQQGGQIHIGGNLSSSDPIDALSVFSKLTGGQP